MNANKKRGLGRGLDALLGSVAPAETPQPGDQLRELALDQLSPGRYQPRRTFDQEALEALAESIRAQGVVQPIVVRPLEGNPSRYEIVAGERRWRAARLAGLGTVPAVIRMIPDRSAMAVALVENIQRADLNPLEEAEALRRLIDECGLTHEETAAAIGRSRAAVSNLLRLMDLEPAVQALVRENRLSMGHAKVLVAVEGERQCALAQQVVEQSLSVRDTERLLAASEPDGRVSPARRKATPTPLEQSLAERIGLPVQLQLRGAGRGRLVIGFSDQEQLDRLLKRLD